MLTRRSIPALCSLTVIAMRPHARNLVAQIGEASLNALVLENEDVGDVGDRRFVPIEPGHAVVG